MAKFQFADTAETIDANPAARLPGSTERLRTAARGMIELVEGSGEHLSTETRALLRQRLRYSALLLFAAFSAFLLRFVYVGIGADVWWLFVIHVVVTAVLGIAAWLLSKGEWLHSRGLRVAEFVIFGAPALFFIFVSQLKLHHTANLADGAHLPIIIAPWMVLMFTYAMFVPNNWRRAALVLVPLATAPLAVVIHQWTMCEGFNRCLAMSEYNSYVIEQSMLMTLALAVSLVGVWTINALRHEVFTAKQLGQYRLKRKLGSGGMGEVFLAEHQMMKRPCAVKLVRPEKAGDARVLARFEREVRMTAKLSHWNSIDIFDYGRTADGTFYYVMEYLPGHNVGEIVDGHGPMPAARVVYLMRQVCAALAEAHGVGLVHRDIKPANIFSAYRGGEFDVAKLLDFGLAKPAVDATETQLTQEGSITGSPLYMSPEQATGDRDTDGRSDIYSLGAVMYHLLTGQPPFPYSQPMKVIVAHVSQPPAPLRDLNPEIPAAFEEIVLRCLEKDPEDRFQQVTELRQALEELVLDDLWSADMAAEWWNCKGCPERKRMAEEALAAAAV